MQYIQLQMVGAARSWLKSRRKNSYDCWEDFEDNFIKSFKSTCQRPVTVGQLKACKQRSDENLRGYIQRWTVLKNSTENISEETSVNSFTNGLYRKDLREYVGPVKVETLSHLMEVANSWTDGEELVHNASPRSPKNDNRFANERRYNHDTGRRRKRKGRGYNEMESTEMVAAEFPASRSNDYRKQGREPTREPARDQGRERGHEKGREWQPRKIQTDGLPPCQSSNNLRVPV